MQGNEREAKAMRLLGFAAKAGRVTAGVPLICTAMQKGAGGNRPLVVLLAADASENTKKRITDKTTYYRVPLRLISADCATLATAVGKRDGAVAAVGISEPSLAREILDLLEA